MSKKTVSILGLGYIGLPTALIAAKQFSVFGFDVNANKIKDINAGISPILEPGIEPLLQEHISNKTFKAYNRLQAADYFIIAVPTPFKQNKQADLSYVFAAGEEIAKQLQPGNTVIIESTIPVETTNSLAQLLEKKSGLMASKDFFVAHCPERVLPGKILAELVKNDRIIGGICKTSAQKAYEFYKPFVTGTCYLTDDKTAELVKLIENASRDTQIAFANQVAGICKEININPFTVINLANKHPRVNILQPGCGVGGHCIAVDPWFLIEQFPNNTQLLKAARNINDQKPHTVIQDILSSIKDNSNPRVLILGLTFKPNVDDLRESPALQIALELQKHIKNLYVYEPWVSPKALDSLGFKNQYTQSYSLEDFDTIVALVKHDAYKSLDLKQLKKTIFIDPCGLLQ